MPGVGCDRARVPRIPFSLAIVGRMHRGDVKFRPACSFRAALALIGLLTAGCAHETPTLPGSVTHAHAPQVPSVEETGNALIVPGHAGWVNTGTSVNTGEALTISARGFVRTEGDTRHDDDPATAFGPEGSYLYGDNVERERFPLPAAAGGPAPVYCLIGRIDGGPPFYIGANHSRFVSQSGMLQLAVNDFDHSNNCGEFIVHVHKSDHVRPVSLQQRQRTALSPQTRSVDGQLVTPACEPQGRPLVGGRVVVFYIDGLRPDVIREMAAMGHIPQINALFVEGGVHLPNTFTAFPSDTITSNGTMWTGCFSDRHGIKGQVRFSRRTLHSASYLDPLGPSRSARALSPQGWDAVVHESSANTLGLIAGADAENRFRAENVTGVPPLFEYLRANGGDWATGALPMMPAMPPLLWSRSLVRSLPYFHTHEAWKYIDDANTHYAQWQLFDRKAPVTIVWLPETDSVSHKLSRGQFGVTRRTIAEADRFIARMVKQLHETGELARTYFVLVSDHGHHGGRYRHLSHFDLANQFFFEPRKVSPEGRWVGGGLGVSVRQHRISNRHREDGSKEFAFVDGDSDGAARIYLPAGHFRSGEWIGGSRPADLLQYRIAPHLPPVNLPQALVHAQATNCNTGYNEHPVDLVLLKLSEHSMLITTADRGQAVIERFCDAAGNWQYRYSVVTDVTPLGTGEVSYRVVAQPTVDPLELLSSYPADILQQCYDERTWLRMTTHTKYPDAVVALTRHMLWQRHLAEREKLYAPDLVVTARGGWYFGTEATKGTTHGYPLADAVRATMFVSGPNIRRGCQIDEPCRLADLTPTLLEMTGNPQHPSCFDGRALRSIYETGTCNTMPVAEREATFWHDFDLGAWHELCYTPGPRYEHLPISINQPDSPLDLNNLARNALTVTDLNVVRLADTALFPVFQREVFLPRIEAADQHVRWRGTDWLAEAAPIADVSNIALGDYEPLSLGNLKRMDRGVDWAQQRLVNLNRNLHGDDGNMANQVCDTLDASVDLSQAAVWETYRFAQRLLIKLLDETAINTVEDGVNHVLNRCRRPPAEVVVPR